MFSDDMESLSALSIELKSYLGITLNCIDLIETKITDNKNDLNENDLCELIDVAKTNVYRTLCVANNFIDADRLMKDKYSLNILTHDLTETIKRNLDTVERYVKTRGASLEFVCNVPDIFLVDTDESIIDRILLNLISNSIKYLPNENGRIIVKLELEGSIVKISVCDNGKGISKSFLPHVFDCYYTNENLRNTGVTTTRMGMYVSKMLANLLDGDISVESEPFMNTTFTLSMRKKQNTLNTVEFRSDSKDLYYKNYMQTVKCIFASLNF